MKISNLIKVILGSIMLFQALPVKARPLFFDDGSLTDEAIDLCKVLKIDDKITDARSFNDFFQKNFLRPKMFERWYDYDLGSILPIDAFPNIVTACRNLGMLDNVLPSKTSYDCVILFGSNTVTMGKICDFVKNELGNVLKNNHETKIFFLTGDRPLDARVDSKQIVKYLTKRGIPATETEAAKLIWKKNMGKRLKCTFVSVSFNEVNKNNGELKRPNTRDTVKKLLANYSISACDILAISINPFIPYQDNVLRNVLIEQGFFTDGGTLETVGYTSNEKLPSMVLDQRHVINILLDTIARCAFEEIKHINK